MAGRLEDFAESCAQMLSMDRRKKNGSGLFMNLILASRVSDASDFSKFVAVPLRGITRRLPAVNPDDVFCGLKALDFAERTLVCAGHAGNSTSQDEYQPERRDSACLPRRRLGGAARIAEYGNS